MVDIVTKVLGPSPKGDILTSEEVDQNFLNLKAAAEAGGGVQLADSVTVGNLDVVSWVDSATLSKAYNAKWISGEGTSGVNFGVDFPDQWQTSAKLVWQDTYTRLELLSTDYIASIGGPPLYRSLVNLTANRSNLGVVQTWTHNNYTDDVQTDLSAKIVDTGYEFSTTCTTPTAVTSMWNGISAGEQAWYVDIQTGSDPTKTVFWKTQGGNFLIGFQEDWTDLDETFLFMRTGEFRLGGNPGTPGQVLISGGTGAPAYWGDPSTGGGGSGDVVGPSISAAGLAPIFSNTTGKLIGASNIFMSAYADSYAQVYVKYGSAASGAIASSGTSAQVEVGGNNPSSQYTFVRMAADIAASSKQKLEFGTFVPLDIVDGGSGKGISLNSSGAVGFVAGTTRDFGSKGQIFTSRGSSAEAEWSNGGSVLGYQATSHAPAVVQAGSNWSVSSTPADNTWQSVCFGANLFVAVASSGSGNRVMTSPDGVTWTTRSTSGLDNTWRSVAYGNGVFVAVSYDGNAMTSTDGITWIDRSPPAGHFFTRIAFGNGVFVAVANSGGGASTYICTTTDGITWTARSTGAGGFDAVAYGEIDGQPRWIVAGYGISYWSDNDGATWTVGSGLSTQNHSQAAFGNGVFVVLRNTGTGTPMPYLSYDGKTWTASKTVYDGSWTAITYACGLFVASNNNEILTSSDGRYWTRRPSFTANNISSLCFGVDRFVGVCSSGSGNRAFTCVDDWISYHPTGAIQIDRLIATAASSSTTLASTGLKLFVEANAVYEIDCFITFQSAATTTGLNLGLATPSGSTNRVEIVVPVTSTAAASQLRTIFPNAAVASNLGNVIGTGVTATGSNHTGRISGIIEVGSNSGDCDIRYATEVASSAVTLQVGSVLKLRRIR